VRSTILNLTDVSLRNPSGTMSEHISRRQLLVRGAASVIATSDTAQILMGQASVTCAQLKDGFHFDDLGLIVQQNCDGGDTAQREGMYWLGNWMWENDLKLGSFGSVRSKPGFTQVMDLARPAVSAAIQHSRSITVPTRRPEIN
jgi:hypothetical protein